MSTNPSPKIYLDIETFAGFNKPSLDDISAPANYKDEEKIKAYKEDNLDKIWRKQALDSMKGVVICLCYAVNDEPVQTVMGEEKDIIQALADLIAEYPWATIVGHNVKRFDIPFLWHRAVKYRQRHLTVALPHSRQDYERIIDTMEVFSASSFGSDSWLSLDTLANFLGLPVKDSQGSEIHDLYINKEYDKIAEHCRVDVALTREIYKLTQ